MYNEQSLQHTKFVCLGTVQESPEVTQTHNN